MIFVDTPSPAVALSAQLYIEAAEWLHVAAWALAGGEDDIAEALVLRASLRLVARATLRLPPAE